MLKRGKAKTLVNDGQNKLYLERYTNGTFLESDGCIHHKMTVARARKLVQALMPYTEWTPDVYGKGGGQ